MKKKFIYICMLILSLIFLLSPQILARTHSKSRNGIDKIEIKRITPRSRSYLLKPVNMPVHMKIEYNLKSKKKAKIVIYFYKFIQKGISPGMFPVEMTNLRKVITIDKGKGSMVYISKPVKIGLDEKVIELYTATSLVDMRGKELAFSTSKNMVGGSYRIFPENKQPDGNYIRKIGVSPPIGTDIKTGNTAKFEISLNYSLKAKPFAFIDILFTDVASLGTGRCWDSATIAVPKGRGKIILKPEVYVNKNLSGTNLGLGIIYWLKPLSNSENYLRIKDYFLR
ncbi:MAG: hypothetical protein K8T10_10350 [Candidatus Eremiobacteraeota bacterium]|nr:hypothetical protein [Candidatus Eremiobacteraeota bacterium]